MAFAALQWLPGISGLWTTITWEGDPSHSTRSERVQGVPCLTLELLSNNAAFSLIGARKTGISQTTPMSNDDEGH